MTDRYKSVDELSASEHLLILRAKKRGLPTPKFERDSYAKAKIAALRDAGLEQEADEEEEAAAPLPKSAAGHLQHIKRQHGAAAKAGRAPRLR